MTAVDEPIKSIALILLLLLLLLLFLVEFASSPPETAAVAAEAVAGELNDTDGAVTLFLLLPAPALTCVSEFRRAAAVVVVAILLMLMLLLVRPIPATVLVLS